MLPREAMSRWGNTTWAVFTPQQSTTTTNGWVSWQKPNGCQWVYFLMIASGGGGNGTGAAGAGGPGGYGSGGGGGGNSSGAGGTAGNGGNGGDGLIIIGGF